MKPSRSTNIHDTTSLSLSPSQSLKPLKPCGRTGGEHWDHQDRTTPKGTCHWPWMAEMLPRCRWLAPSVALIILVLLESSTHFWPVRTKLGTFLLHDSILTSATSHHRGKATLLPVWATAVISATLTTCARINQQDCWNAGGWKDDSIARQTPERY